MKIAISGKGGVGKTTVASLLAQGLRDRGRRVFAIDADSDANLAVALGFPDTTMLTPLAEMHELIHERTGAAPGTQASFFTMNPRVDDIPDRFSLEHNKIKLMVMGTVRRGGSGCACPEHVIVKEFLRHLLVERDEVVILDTSAGIEHFSRGMARYVDLLLVTVQATSASIQTCMRIKSMAADLGIATVRLVANRVHDRADLTRIQAETGLDIFAAIPESAQLADYHGTIVDGAVAEAVQSLIDALEELVK
jgi:CO dehydrogenase maturation factor